MKKISEQLLFETFFGIMHILGSGQPKSECIFLFPYNFIFKPYHLSSPLAQLWREIQLCPRRLFCPKFDAEKLLFEAFLGIMRIFDSVQPWASITTHRQGWQRSDKVLSPVTSEWHSWVLSLLCQHLSSCQQRSESIIKVTKIFRACAVYIILPFVTNRL